MNFELVREIKDSESRYIVVQVKIENMMMTLLCVYLLSQTDQNIMKKNKTKETPQTKVLRKGLEEMVLLDVWTDSHLFDKYYNFYSAPHTEYSGIDSIFMFQNDRHRFSSGQ